MNSLKSKIFVTITAIIIVFNSITIAKTVSKTYYPSTFTVVIDAGHGGIDCGAEGVNTGVKESDINLIIAKNLREKFAVLGVKTIMTREDNGGLYGTTDPGFKMRDLVKRVEISNGANANLFISIHLNNYSSPSRRGAQAFYKKGDENAKLLAKSIQTRLNVMKSAPRMCEALSGDYYLLNQVKTVSVIVECGFLSSPEDEKLLLSESYREEICLAIFQGSVAYLTRDK